MRHDRASGADRVKQIQLERAFPVFQRCFQESSADGTANVRNQKINGAQRRRGLSDETLNRAGLRYIGHRCHHGNATGAKHLRCRPKVLRGSTANRQMASLVSQTQRDAASDSAAAARDDRCLACKVQVHSVSGAGRITFRLTGAKTASGVPLFVRPVEAVVGRLLRRNLFRRHPPWKSHNGPTAYLLILAEALGKFLQIVIAGGE